MSKATINDKASGVWRANVGVEVDVQELAPNGRAACCSIPHTAPHAQGHKRAWIPTSWLDGAPQPKGRQRKRMTRKQAIAHLRMLSLTDAGILECMEALGLDDE
jgi:hypothetical protein